MEHYLLPYAIQSNRHIGVKGKVKYFILGSRQCSEAVANYGALTPMGSILRVERVLSLRLGNYLLLYTNFIHQCGYCPLGFYLDQQP